MSVSNDDKTEILARITHERYPEKIKKILVVGCGSGAEAAVLAKKNNASVIGIDMQTNFSTGALRVADLQQGDATCLKFGNNEFDFVYSFHALEHIPDFRKALSEMHRVLRCGGVLCLGVPNRSRLFAYVFKEGNTWEQKIVRNVNDWKRRLQGQFRNELGAHAGFTAVELHSELQKVFGAVRDITQEYYCYCYRNYSWLVKVFFLSRIGRILFPSIYFLGEKNHPKNDSR